MIGVIIFWESNEQNRYSGDKWSSLLWHDTIKPLGAKLLIMIDPNNLQKHFIDEDMIFETYNSLYDALLAHKKKEFVFLEAERGIPTNIEFNYLKNFKHPKGDTLYIVGPDTNGINFKEINEFINNNVVAIQTEKNYAIWSFIAIAIALYDRRLKNGSNGS